MAVLSPSTQCEDAHERFDLQKGVTCPMRTSLLLFLSAVLLPLTACSSSAPEPDSAAGSVDVEVSVAEPSITATVRNRAEVEQLVASHQGKVVVIDLWALW